MEELIDWQTHLYDSKTEELEKMLDGKTSIQQGTQIHEWLSENPPKNTLEYETNVYSSETGEYVGRFDAYDPDGVIYEFKTKDQFQGYDMPYQEDLNQVEKYLEAVDEAELGVVVYINRSSFETSRHFTHSDW